MTRSHIIVLLGIMLAVPAAAVGGGSMFAGDDAACFSAGTTGYRLTGKRSADYTIKIDNTAAQPDLTLQMADDPAVADFVLADGTASAGTCRDLRSVRTIRVDLQARDPDLTIALVSGDAAGRYKIYANSSAATAQDAAALFAVMWKSGRRSAALR